MTSETRRGKLSLVALLLAAAALALSACGGDGDDGDQQEAVTDTIEESFTSGEKSVCSDLHTDAYNQQAYAIPGDLSVLACEQTAKARQADSVEVTKIVVDGDSASANVAVMGGYPDGQTLALDLVKEDDQWKLDHIDGFVDFDRAAFDKQLRSNIQNSEAKGRPAVADCMMNRLGKLSDEEIQKLYTRGDQTAFNFLVPCTQIQG